MERAEGVEVKRFDFGRDFGEGEKKKEKMSLLRPVSGVVGGEKDGGGESEVAKVWTEGDVESARREGEERGRVLGLEEGREKYYREGYGVGESEGRAKGREDAQVLSLKVSEKIGVEIQGFVEERKEEFSRMREGCVQVALAVLKKVMPLYEEKHGHEELKVQLSSVLFQLVEEDEISVWVSRSYEGKGEEAILDLFTESGLRDRVKLGFEDSMGVSDVRVVWKGGSLERNMEKIWSSVEGIVLKEEG